MLFQRFGILAIVLIHCNIETMLPDEFREQILVVMVALLVIAIDGHKGIIFVAEDISSCAVEST